MSQCSPEITTRRELCNQLVRAKENATIRLIDSLPAIWQLSKQKVDAIEDPEVDCYISDVLLYLQMCRASFDIALYDEEWIDNMDELRECIKTMRKDVDLSVVDLAKRARVSSHIIERFLYNKGNLSTDSFLRILNALGASLTI